MPVIGIPVEELTKRIGRAVDREELLRILGDIGCDVEGYEVLGRARCAACGTVFEMVGKEEAPPRCERCNADLRASADALQTMPGLEVVRMDLLAVRPDIFDPGGLARALRGLLSIETGLAQYTVGPPALRLHVDDSVRRERSLRPYIACAVMENATIDEDRLKILMKLQENLHWALGRDRKLASIGVYDLDSLHLSEGQDLEYTTEDPDDYRFVPLGAPGTGPEEERTLRRILEEHPKGTAYAHLLAGFDRYPILRVRGGLVLSMPPIINSEQTKVHTGSRRLYILVTSLLELDPGMRLSAVELVNATAASGEASRSSRITPDLSPEEAWLDVARTEKLMGFPLSPGDVRDLLLRMRHGIEGTPEGTKLRVLVPAYRNDILHERDLMEDIAIAYGYSNVPRSLVPDQTLGREPFGVRLSERMGDVMTGLGFIEVLGIVLTSPEQSDVLLDLPPHPATALVENPISTEQTQLRTSLLPGLLLTLARNRHHPLPQAIFEAGDVTFVRAEAETGAEERPHVAFALISPKAGFADVRALAEAVLRELGWELRLRAHDPEFLLEGRGALLSASENGAEIPIGVMGEVHPRVLERLGLQNPTVVCEIALPGEKGPRPYLFLTD
jgi:phenylalanyl-tRNA synthetase beta chain